MLKSDVYGSDFLKTLEVLGGAELFRRTYEALEDKTEMLVWNEKTGIRSMSQEEFEQKLKLIERKRRLSSD